LEVRTDDSLRQLFTTGDYAWILVVYGAHRTIDGAIKRASAHLDML